MRASRLPLLALAAALGGAPARAETVRVVTIRGAVEHCSALGEVSGSSLLGFLLGSTAHDQAIEEMKEKALALGGTHLLVKTVTTGIIGADGSGEAFGCPIETPPTPRRRR